MGTLGPTLHESMQCLIVGASFLTRKSENEVCEACVSNPILDDLRKTVIPRPYSTEIPNTFKGLGIML